MAAVDLIADWKLFGVTESPYQLLTDAESTTTAGACDSPANFTCDRDAPGGCLCEDGNEKEEKARSPPNWPVFLLFVIVIMTIGGNVLVCLAVGYKRKLQNMFNYFLVSLALSDMLSAILVMPLSIIKTAVGMYPYTTLVCFAHLQ